MPKPKIIIKDDNVDLYEIDSNDAFRMGALSDDEQKAIHEANAKFTQEVIEPVLFQYCNPCQCRMAEVQERMMARIRLMPNPPPPGTPIAMELLQEDVDAREFGIVVLSDSGVYKDIALVIVRCKNCNTVNFYGQIKPITYLMARAFTDHSNREAALAPLREAASGESDEYTMTDLDTGEKTGCNDLGEALFGTKDKDGELSLGDAVDKVVQFPGVKADSE